jgi:hypothetical protein
MTREDFSNGFDTLLNSYAHTAVYGSDTSMQDIRVDEYEKSQYLTLAQEELVISLYNGKNSFGEGFEQTEELRRYLASLVVETMLDPVVDPLIRPTGVAGDDSYFFVLPDGRGGRYGVWFIIYEAVKVTGKTCDSGELEVVPIRHDEYHKVKKNPFRGANDRRALRLDFSDLDLGELIEIVCKYTVNKYHLRYLRKPTPIVLTGLIDGETINGVFDPTNCELPDSLHQKILEMAVLRCLQSKGIGVASQIRKEDIR